MRYASWDGPLIDVYQATTQLTYESFDSDKFKAAIDGLLDRALGPEGYYCVIGTHYDYSSSVSDKFHDDILKSALDRKVPMVSSLQMLKWLDGRNNSSFKDITWKEGALQFVVEVGDGARGLQAMVPTRSLGVPLAITRNNAPIKFSIQTIKGIEYAFFDALAGTYIVSAKPGVVPPVYSDPAVSSWGKNRLDVFARVGKTLWHKWWDGAWHDWVSLGGELTSAPCAVSWGPNRIDVFAKGKDNALWHKWWDGAWHDWVSLGGELTSAPCAVSWGPNHIDVFAKGKDDVLRHMIWDGTKWTNWVNLGSQ